MDIARIFLRQTIQTARNSRGRSKKDGTSSSNLDTKVLISPEKDAVTTLSDHTDNQPADIQQPIRENSIDKGSTLDKKPDIQLRDMEISENKLLEKSHDATMCTDVDSQQTNNISDVDEDNTILDEPSIQEQKQIDGEDSISTTGIPVTEERDDSLRPVPSDEATLQPINNANEVQEESLIQTSPDVQKQEETNIEEFIDSANIPVREGRQDSLIFIPWDDAIYANSEEMDEAEHVIINNAEVGKI